MTTKLSADVVVVGAGPAGASCAFWLATAGHEVLALEKRAMPREKTCGDGLTPRAVHELSSMGIDPKREGWHRIDGLRALAHGIRLELPWPEHPVYPSEGYVVRRRELDHRVAAQARAAGAELMEGVRATGVEIGSDGIAVVRASDSQGQALQVRARYLVVADGANSRIGRALGARRRKGRPQGMALRGYIRSPLHDEHWIESSLDVGDRNGSTLPGYGWVFPVGDGWINVGVGVLSTYRHWKEVNTSHIYSSFLNSLGERWGIDENSERTKPIGGRLPMGGSIEPAAGPGWILAGDAAGSINPFNGEGIDYAYETGRLAAQVLSAALRRNDPGCIARYPELLQEKYGRYWRTGRQFTRLVGDPRIMKILTMVGMRSHVLMQWVLAVMANLMRTDRRHAPERLYSLMECIAKAVPEPRG